MFAFFENYFKKDLILSGYSSSEEYLHDEFLRVYIQVKNFIEYFFKQDSDEFYESKNTFLKKNDLNIDKIMAAETFSRAKKYIWARLKKTDEFIIGSSNYIKKVYNLSDLEWFCVIVGIAKKKGIFEKISNDLKELNFNYEMIIKIYYFEEFILDIPNYYEIFHSLSAKMNDFCFYDNFEIDTNLCDFILSNGESEFDFLNTKIYYPSIDKNRQLDVREDISNKFGKFLKNDSNEKKYFFVSGKIGQGKRSIVKRAAEISENYLIMLDLDKNILENDKFFSMALISSLRRVHLMDGTFCITNFELMMTTEYEKKINLLIKLVKKYSKKLFILANISSDDNNNLYKNCNFSKYDENFEFSFYKVSNLKKEESIELWEKFLKEVCDLNQKDLHKISCDMANKFKFSISQIKNTVQALKNLCKWECSKNIDINKLCECAYLQITNDFSYKAKAVDCRKNWDDLILADSEKNMLKSACAQIKFRHIVYDKWNFKEKIIYGRGVSMLFSGPPGTGKTMAAAIIANDLRLKLYKINVSAIISKYIGETEKNLDEIFELAQKGNVILFFDETDAIFGKRTEVKDSHDKNANVEVSYLLQKMEEFDGVTIMTTNFQNNIDAAFFRRINYVVHFTLPNSEFRKKIWKGIFPKELPMASDIDFDFLAKNFEISGGNIKNIALVAAFLAAQEGSNKLEFIHLLNAVKYELKKQGSTILNDEFGKYSYLLS